MSEQAGIIVGTTVRLNDVPSPLMRVLRIHADGSADCFWFDKHHHPQQWRFLLSLLTRAAPYVFKPREETDPPVPGPSGKLLERRGSNYDADAIARSTSGFEDYEEPVDAGH